MSVYDFTISKEYADHLNEMVRNAYPNYADAARKIMSEILYRCDKQLWLVFNGEIYDRKMHLGVMSSTHFLICELLQNREMGMQVPDWYIEHTIRCCLGLGFTSINGGKS